MKRRLLALVPVILLSGCSLVPWHPFGTPITAEAKAKARVEVAQSKAGDALVEEVHKTNDAITLAVAGNPQALSVAQQHSRVSVTLADQVHGTPTVIDEQKWQKLVDEQSSLDAKVRAIADAESQKRIGQIAKLSTDLDQKNDALTKANQLVVQYAAKEEAVAGWFLKVTWAIGAVLAFIVLARVLGFVAQFYPGLAPASAIVNHTLAKVLHPSFRPAVPGTPAS